MGRKRNMIQFEYADFLENTLLHTEVRQIRENMAQIERNATESLHISNWNKQLFNLIRKNIKIHNLKESCGEHIIQDCKFD